MRCCFFQQRCCKATFSMLECGSFHMETFCNVYKQVLAHLYQATRKRPHKSTAPKEKDAASTELPQPLCPSYPAPFPDTDRRTHRLWRWWRWRKRPSLSRHAATSGATRHAAHFERQYTTVTNHQQRQVGPATGVWLWHRGPGHGAKRGRLERKLQR